MIFFLFQEKNEFHKMWPLYTILKKVTPNCVCPQNKLYIFQITFWKFWEKLPLFQKCPCLLFNKQGRNSWLKLTQMLLWRCDEMSSSSIICPRRDKIRASLCLSRSHFIMHTELGWECEKTLCIPSLPPSEELHQWGTWNC